MRELGSDCYEYTNTPASAPAPEEFPPDYSTMPNTSKKRTKKRTLDSNAMDSADEITSIPMEVMSTRPPQAPPIPLTPPTTPCTEDLTYI